MNSCAENLKKAGCCRTDGIPKAIYTLGKIFLHGEKMQPQLTLTRISSKGQVVIPGQLRKKLRIHSGEYFAVTQLNNMLVLKRLSGGMTPSDVKTLGRLKEAWDDFEAGRYKKVTLDELMRELS